MGLTAGQFMYVMILSMSFIIHASVTKQYNLLLANFFWVRKLTAGLAKRVIMLAYCRAYD